MNVVANKAIASVEDKVDVSVYFKASIQESEILNARYRVESMSEVESVSYVSKEEALEKFKQQHANDPIILESLEQLETNPLGATLVIKAKSIEYYPRIMTFLEDPAYEQLIQDKNYEDNKEVVDKLNDLSNRIQRIGIIISVIFIIIAVLIIFNTIRINIYTHREEIGIMKLVGASNWFVRAPFLVESFMYAFLSVILCLAIMYPLLGVVAPQVNNFFTGYNLDIVDYFSSNFWKIVGLQFVFAIVLSIFSSGIAIGRYLKV